jgi:hypothetical protein
MADLTCTPQWSQMKFAPPCEREVASDVIVIVVMMVDFNMCAGCDDCDSSTCRASVTCGASDAR